MNHPRIVRRGAAIVLALILCAAGAEAASVTIAWNPSPESDVVGYTVSWGTQSRVYTFRQDVAAGVTSLLISNLQSGVTYYFAVQAFNSAGLISDYSAEVSDLIGGGTPAPPTVTAILPTLGFTAGGTTITITGANFQTGATVTVGGVAAANVTVSSATSITATTPAHAAGVVSVTVTNADGQASTLPSAFTYVVRRVVFDYSGDGRSDVVWRHATRGEVWLWPMVGATLTAELPVSGPTTGWPGPNPSWEIRGLADLTGDGQADILWRNKTNGMVYLWPMHGPTPVSETYVASVQPAYNIVGTGDYNGDGKTDILWRHTTAGDVWVWQMNGATMLSETHLATVNPGYAVVGSRDVDGDGRADIVWRHATRGEVWIWLMDGPTIRSESYVGTVPDTGYEIVGSGDYDGDGKADILWRHATRGEVWIWLMDGTTMRSESYVDTVRDVGYEIVGSGDYDGDGRADILWHHSTRGEVWVWLMDGTNKRSETYVATVPDVGYQVQYPR